MVSFHNGVRILLRSDGGSLESYAQQKGREDKEIKWVTTYDKRKSALFIRLSTNNLCDLWTGHWQSQNEYVDPVHIHIHKHL